MGSDSDWPTLKAAADICEQFSVAHEVTTSYLHIAHPMIWAGMQKTLIKKA